jgi:predicted transcriptional regulator
MGVKLDEQTRTRLKSVSEKLDRTPHWFMKKAILQLIGKVEAGASIEDVVDPDTLEKDSLRHSISLRRPMNSGSCDLG